MEQKLTPPIGRVGGKSQIAARIIKLFPPHKIYVEPFVGAGNIIYRKPFSQIEIINDLDKDMYKIFCGIKSRGDWIDKNIYRTYLTKYQFDSIKDKNDLMSLLYKYHCSFSSKGETYNDRNFFKQGKNPSIWKANFSALQDRLKDVQIYNDDYKNIIRHFDSPDTFFYLDPPYENTKKYTNYVSPEDVYLTLKKIKGKFLLSYNDSPRIREIFKEFRIRNVSTKYTGNLLGTSNNEKVNELIITNY